MANGQINLTISDKRVGRGLESTKKDAKDLGDNLMESTGKAGKFGSALGKLHGIGNDTFQTLLGGLSEFAKGSVWGVAMMAVSGLANALKKWGASVEEAIFKPVKAIEKSIEALKKYDEMTRKVIDSAANQKKVVAAHEEETKAIYRKIKAEAELERQRRIANGEAADSVNADINARNASTDRFENARAASLAAGLADVDLGNAQKVADIAAKRVQDVLSHRAAIQSMMSRRAQEVFYEDNRFAVRHGLLSLNKSGEASYMKGRNDKVYTELQKQLETIEKEIASAMEKQAAAAADLQGAAKKRAAAVERVRAVEAENHAAELKEATEAAAEIEKQNAEIQAKLEQDRADAEKRAQDAADREFAFQQQLFDEEQARQAKAEKDALKKRLEDIKTEHKAKMEAIDKEIAKAKEESAIWERNAQQVRDFSRNNGGGFAAWNAMQRDEAREKSRGDAKQKNAIRVAEAEYKRLFAESEKRGDKMNPARRKRMKELEEFLELNLDPHKGERKVKELEKKRQEAELQAQKDIRAIKDLLQQGVAL